MICWKLGPAALWVVLACSAGFSAASAQQFDPQQIRIIEDAAASICNEVRGAKGRKNNLEIEGDVKAQLGAFFDKFAAIGASGKIKSTREEFEGLSQEATAAALERSSGCRERVFNKMFDKLVTSPQSGPAAYRARGSDLRTVNSFFPHLDEQFSRLEPNPALPGCDQWFYYRTDDIHIDDKMMRIENSTDEGVKDCPGFSYDWSKSTTECSANLSELDDVIHVPECCPKEACRPDSAVFISCLSGKCVSCKATTREGKEGQGLQQPKEKTMEYVTDAIQIWLGPQQYNVKCSEFYDFIRALSRIISNGSDQAFCKVQPNYCAK